MRISDAERSAIRKVLQAGNNYGYGNMIQHLATAWAKHLMDKYKMDERTARNGAFGLDGYPFEMQADLMNRGEWDETGERYSKKG